MESKVRGASPNTKRRFPDFRSMMVMLFSMILILASNNSPKEATEKGTKISEGETMTTVSQERHVLVDFHPLERLQDKQKVGMGVIHPQTPAKQECNMSQTSKDGTTTLLVTPHTQSKRIPMPAGTDAVVLTGQIGSNVDRAYGLDNALELASKEY
jgi:hypothetical protein